MNEIGRSASTLLLALSLLRCTKTEEQPEISGIDETFLDRSADPCTDFYQFACGTWIKEHPNDKYPNVVFLEGAGRSSILLRKLLDTDRAGAPYVPDRDATLLGDHFDSCIRGRQAAGVPHGALDALLTSISKAATLDDIAIAVASLHANGIAAFFWLGADVDAGNPSRNIATLYTGGWNLDSSYFMSDPMGILPQYEVHVDKTAALFFTKIDSKQAVLIEGALATSALTREARQDPHVTYNLTPIATLSAGAMSFPWAKYLQAAGLGSVTEINVSDVDYFTKLDALIGIQTIDALKAYLSWQVLESYAFALGQPFVVEEARFHSGVLFGNPNPSSDEGACVGSTASAFGFSLSRPYVSVLFDDAKRSGALKILGSITGALHREIDSRSWIDDATRAEAQQKLGKIDVKVGYPDVWPDPIVSLGRSDSYLQWWLAIRQASRKKEIASLGEAVDRKAWRTEPLVTNAFYSGAYNEIVFPAAVLQSPEFALERPSALNYGTIGSIMGHEMTHGFDSKGRRFDGDGKLRDWWTPGVDAEFVRRATCVADQYSHYEPLPGQTIDGELTLGENIADLGGAKLAYAAYKASGANESFSGPYDADQQFFLSFAQVRCSNEPDTVTAFYLHSDTHSPDKYRVNGVVTNLPEFANAFHCAAGSPMSPASRCDLW